MFSPTWTMQIDGFLEFFLENSEKNSLRDDFEFVTNSFMIALFSADIIIYRWNQIRQNYADLRDLLSNAQ